MYFASGHYPEVGSHQTCDDSVRGTPDGSLLPDRDDRNYKTGGICRRQHLHQVGVCQPGPETGQRNAGAVREPPLRGPCILPAALFTLIIDNVGSRQACDDSVRDPDWDDWNYSEPPPLDLRRDDPQKR